MRRRTKAAAAAAALFRRMNHPFDQCTSSRGQSWVFPIEISSIGRSIVHRMDKNSHPYFTRSHNQCGSIIRSAQYERGSIDRCSGGGGGRLNHGDDRKQRLPSPLISAPPAAPRAPPGQIKEIASGNKIQIDSAAWRISGRGRHFSS